jgi:hypothetical protein
VIKYIGKEAGIKDHTHDNKKAQSDEGERYRDTKKKNKGRRVSVRLNKDLISRI